MIEEKCVAILGPGLLGGSLAMAVPKRNLASRIHVWARREEAVAQISAAGLADFASTDLREVTADATLIILATPVPFMAAIAEQLATFSLQPGVLVTDVGSVKATVVEQAGSTLRAAGVEFIGSHPMAGSEQAGLEAARSDLFDGAACIITPQDDTDQAQLSRLELWWSALGCHVSKLSPGAHDEAIGRISHLLHIAASVLTLRSFEK
ncbi:MAG: prephenate dehydrogenase/arogenate dehydrogenase family protein [Verrucomicrobiales bacterium]